MEKIMNQQYTMELRDYIAILRKRKLPFFGTFLLIMVTGITIAFTLPSVYRSEATILIERQEIPQNLVASTVTGYVQERIEGIRQKLVTYENLAEIAKNLNLFPALREKGDTSTMVDIIRNSISVEMVDVKASDSSKPGQAIATVAFTVGFESDSPAVAQQVANELAERYLVVNKQARGEQAAEVSQFLEQETEKLRVEIVELEKALATFKQEQSAQLPELLQVNMRLYEKTEGQIEASKDRILKIEDQIVALESELSLTDPRKDVRTDDGKIVQSPSERLNTLTSAYLQSSVRYAPTHPDMVRMRREIEILGNQSSEAAKVNALVSKLTLLKSQLLDVKQKYSDEHPEVQELEKSTAAVENELRNFSIATTKDVSTSNIPADNPRYIALKTQLDTARSNLKEEQSKLEQYSEKLKEYEKRLFQTPIVERDFQALTRDYGNAKKKYEELKNKQMEARLAEQLEAGDKGERFVLEGPAFFPTSPSSPNRLGIVLLAGLLASLGGVGALALAEFKDDSVRGVRGVAKIYGALPIVIIPYIENSLDVELRKKHRLIMAGVAVVLVVIVVVGLYFTGKPAMPT